MERASEGPAGWQEGTVSPWGTGQRGMRPSESTWLPEEIELAPDWVQEEILRQPEECREWLADHTPPKPPSSPTRRGRGGRRGRQPKQ